MRPLAWVLLVAATLGGKRIAAQQEQRALDPKMDYVASIKEIQVAPVQAQIANPSLRTHPVMEGDATRFHIALDLRDIIIYAFNIAGSQLDGATQPVLTNWYDISIVAEHPVDNSQMRLLLRDTLAKRFNMQAEINEVSTQVYALVVAPGGPKFPKLNDGEDQPKAQGPEFVASDVSALVRWLNSIYGTDNKRGVDLPVVDHTNLSGRYAIRLTISAAASSCDGCFVYPEGSVIDIPRLIKSQLGLELQRQAGVFTHVRIISIQQPTAN